MDLWEINNTEIKINYPKKYKCPPNLETKLLTGRNNYQLGGEDETGFTIIKGGASSTVNSAGIKLEWIASGELVELSERQIDTSDALPPKPPEILQKMKWLWQNKTKYGLIIFVAGILVITYFLFQAYLPSLFSQKQSQKTRSPSLTPSEEKSTKENQVPALRVTFIDGKNAIVELVVQLSADPEKLIYIYSRYGEQKAAIDDLLSSIRGNAISILEKYSLQDARINRKEIAKGIILSSKQDMDRTGHIIESISLAEFTEKR